MLIADILYEDLKGALIEFLLFIFFTVGRRALCAEAHGTPQFCRDDLRCVDKRQLPRKRNPFGRGYDLTSWWHGNAKGLSNADINRDGAVNMTDVDGIAKQIIK